MAKWVVQHEFDDEPTLVVHEDDETQCVEFSADIPWEQRVRAAQRLADLLSNGYPED